MALVIMSLHPNPSSNILLPFMHPNLAQICRWWAASTIISDTFDDAVFQQEYVIASDSPISLHRDAFHNDLAYLHCPKQCSKSQAKCPPPFICNPSPDYIKSTPSDNLSIPSLTLCPCSPSHSFPTSNFLNDKLPEAAEYTRMTSTNCFSSTISLLASQVSLTRPPGPLLTPASHLPIT